MLPSYLTNHFTCDNLDADPLLFYQFLAPAMSILTDYVRGVRHKGRINDPTFVCLGVLRVISQVASGRDFLQQCAQLHDHSVSRSSFFDTLHSKPRRGVLAELNAQLVARRGVGPADTGADLLQAFPELRDRAVYAVDGHQLEHASHSRRDSKGRHVPGNTLYMLCLHSGLSVNFGAVQGDGRYQHEMPVFRLRMTHWLDGRSMNDPERPIFVVDPAFVDNQFWTRMVLLEGRGALVITRTKANMRPVVYGDNSWDRAAKINVGVVADEKVGFDGACLMRRVRYTDPETGTQYEFLTTVMDLSPGLIALLYLLRWRIEKVFDTGKNKLEETKAWATGQVAREIQAHFFALTHNLLVLFRRKLATDHDIRERKLEKKRLDWLEKRTAQAKTAGRNVHPVQWKLPPVVQMSLQFIRTLRNGILARRCYRAVLPSFAAMLSGYL